MKWIAAVSLIACIIGWSLLFSSKLQETQRQAIRWASISSLAKLNVDFIVKNGLNSKEYRETVSQWANEQRIDEADAYVRAVSEVLERHAGK